VCCRAGGQSLLSKALSAAAAIAAVVDQQRQRLGVKSTGHRRACDAVASGQPACRVRADVDRKFVNR